MPRGGARSRSGPAPDPLALTRQRDGKEWTTLDPVPIPEADIPDWPDTMPGEALVDELRMWHELWQLPQARVWLADHMIHTVAAYVRTYLEAYEPGGSVGKGTLARQLGESLLLTTQTLSAAKYVIKEPIAGAGTMAGDAAAAKRAPRASASSGVRSRLAAVVPINTEYVTDADDEESWDASPPGHPDEE